MTHSSPQQTRKGRFRRGMVLIWVALTGMVLILFVALAGDAAHVYLAGHQLQNAADAGSLAGALRVRTDPLLAHDAARTLAAANWAGGGGVGGGPVQLASNTGNSPGGDVVIGVYDFDNNSFTATTSSPNAVRVLARRTTGSPGGALPLIFGPALGFPSSDVSRTATAVIGGVIHAGIVLLNPHGTTLSLTGTGNRDKVIVVDGSIQINSNSSNAIGFNGNANITAEELYIGGNQTNAIGQFSVDHVGINSPPVPDPLAALPVPSQGTNRSGATGPNLQPGYYPNGFPNGNLTLASGIYYIRGGINLTGNRTINGTAGVMIYLETGGISFGGNSGMQLNPMSSGPYAGVSLFVARGNTSTVQLKGTPGLPTTGTIYMPSAHADIRGNPEILGSQLIAGSASVQGTAQIKIDYDGRNPVQGHDVWLVN